MRKTRNGSLVVATLFMVMMPVLSDGADLTKYRRFELGADVTTIVKQAGVAVESVKSVHTRPALIQELEWRPPYVASEPDSVRDITFTFFQGALFRIVAAYDRRATEGMTIHDLVEILSATYGMPEMAVQPRTALPDGYGGAEEIVAQWQDAGHRYDLIRAAYGPSFRLVGISKELEARANTASLEAARLDASEAPQREVARQAREQEADASRLDKARLSNKSKFRP